MELVQSLSHEVATVVHSFCPSEETKNKVAQLAKEIFTNIALVASGIGIGALAWYDPVAFFLLGTVSGGAYITYCSQALRDGG